MKKFLLFLFFLLFSASLVSAQNFFGPALKNICPTVPDNITCPHSTDIASQRYSQGNLDFTVVDCEGKERLLVKESTDSSWQLVLIPLTLLVKNPEKSPDIQITNIVADTIPSYFKILFKVIYHANLETDGYIDDIIVLKTIVMDANFYIPD